MERAVPHHGASPDTYQLRLGDYVLLNPLGHGGMGSVFLAEHVVTRQQVAIKVIAPHLAQSPTVVQRFEAEARAVMRIDHPNVIRIEGYGNEAGVLYHVLELLRGRDLDSVMQSGGKLDPAAALPYIKQICAGLQAAHERRIVHRDLKPENIFVLDRKPLTIKLLDFGIAKLLDLSELADLTRTGVVMGSPLFMAPEQAAAEKARISPRSDIYSLGVIVYMMLAGAAPFDCDNIEGMLFNHTSIPPTYIRDHDLLIPEAVAQVVHRCLEKDPVNRPTSAREVALDFEAAIDREAETRFHYVTPAAATGPGIAERPSIDESSPGIGHQDELAETLADGLSAPLELWDATPPAALSEVMPSVIAVVEQPRRWSGAHWLALTMGLCGVASIVVLICVAVYLMR